MGNKGKTKSPRRPRRSICRRSRDDVTGQVSAAARFVANCFHPVLLQTGFQMQLSLAPDGSADRTGSPSRIMEGPARGNISRHAGTAPGWVWFERRYPVQPGLQSLQFHGGVGSITRSDGLAASQASVSLIVVPFPAGMRIDCVSPIRPLCGIYKSAPRWRESANDGSKTSCALLHRSRGLVPVSFHRIKSKKSKNLYRGVIISMFILCTKK